MTHQEPERGGIDRKDEEIKDGLEIGAAEGLNGGEGNHGEGVEEENQTNELHGQGAEIGEARPKPKAEQGLRKDDESSDQGSQNEQKVLDGAGRDFGNFRGFTRAAAVKAEIGE